LIACCSSCTTPRDPQGSTGRSTILRAWGGIVALNTFYGLQPDAPPKPPEAIRLFSDPNYARLTDHFAKSPREFRWLYDFQVGGFIRDEDVRTRFVPLFYRQFTARPSTLAPFLALNRDLNAAVVANTERTSELAAFRAPVRFAFGERDQYLDPALAHSLAALFERGEDGWSLAPTRAALTRWASAVTSYTIGTCPSRSMKPMPAPAMTS
jgi:pimeloyl-ACP methyl ester carboxylesterase